MSFSHLLRALIPSSYYTLSVNPSTLYLLDAVSMLGGDVDGSADDVRVFLGLVLISATREERGNVSQHRVLINLTALCDIRSLRTSAVNAIVIPGATWGPSIHREQRRRHCSDDLYRSTREITNIQDGLSLGLVEVQGGEHRGQCAEGTTILPGLSKIIHLHSKSTPSETRSRMNTARRVSWPTREGPAFQKYHRSWCFQFGCDG